MIRGVLFDLDGTLVNTLEDIAHAMNRALQQHGLPGYAADAYRYMVGNGARILAQRAVGEHPELAEAVLADYQAYYGTHAMVLSRPYAGIPELLKELRARGLRCMVFSNKPDADTCHVISHYFGDEVFSQVRGQRSGVPLKPDPTAALEMTQKEGFAPDEMLYLGDTSVDVTCARNAGMHAVGVTWGFRERQELVEAGAAHVIDRPLDLIGILESLDPKIVGSQEGITDEATKL